MHSTTKRAPVGAGRRGRAHATGWHGRVRRSVSVCVRVLAFASVFREVIVTDESWVILALKRVN